MIESWLTQRARVERPIASTSTYEHSSAMTLVYTSIPFLVQPKSGFVRATLQGQEDSSTHDGFAEPSRDLRQRDHVIINGERYEIAFVATLPTHLECDLATVATTPLPIATP